jgi:hypothetical protein
MLALALLVAATPSPAATRYAGRPLADVLDELQRDGLRLIYSSAVVAPDLVVSGEPSSKRPRRVLDEILAPLGLAARNGAHGTVLIVAAPPAPPADLRALWTESIVVTPGRHDIDLGEATTVQPLDRDQMALAPVPAGDPARIVQLLPGVASAEGSAAFNARGSAGKDVALVLDGLELYDPFHLGAFQAPYSFIDGRMLGSAALLTGGFTADRGDRHGGFLEMSTSVPDESAATVIEAGTLNSRASYKAPTPAGPLLVSGRYWYPEATGDSIVMGRDGLRPTFGDLYAKLGFLTTPTTTLSAHALFASDHASLSETDGNERVVASDRSGYMWLRAVHSWSPAVTTDTVVSGGTLHRSREGIGEPDDALVVARDGRSVSFYGLRNDAAWSFGNGQALRGGFDVRMLSADLSSASGPPGADVTTQAEPSGTSLAAYAAYRATLGARFTAEAGLRWDRQTYTGDREWSPRLNVVWRPGARTELRLGAGRYAQSMRIHELRIEDGETAYRPPEVARQIDVAWIQKVKSLEFRVEGYRHQLTHVQPRYENQFHPLELFPEVEPDRITVAPERAELSGIEVSLRGGGGGPLFWLASYTRSRATDVIDGVDVPRSWDQPHAGTALVAYRWASGWFASAAAIAHTGWPTTPVTGRVVTLPDGETEIEPVLGPRNSERLPVYARLDLKGGRAVSTRKGTFRFELIVANATNRENACCVDEVTFTQRPDGGVDAATTIDTWMGITPSFSATWEF